MSINKKSLKRINKELNKLKLEIESLENNYKKKVLFCLKNFSYIYYFLFCGLFYGIYGNDKRRIIKKNKNK